MSRYRKPSQTRRNYARRNGVSLGWLWLISGIFLGALAAVLIYERFTNLKPNNTSNIKSSRSLSASPSPTTKTHTNHGSKTPVQGKSSKADTAAKTPLTETVQEFEFYTLLPGMEVQVPENQGASKTIKPPEQNPQTIKNPATSPTSMKTHTPSTRTPHAKESALKSDTKPYIIEAGMFRDFGQADSLKAKLALQGFNPHIQKVMTERGETWFRVALGPYYSESLANTQKQSLLALKVRGIVIPQKAK